MFCIKEVAHCGAWRSALKQLFEWKRSVFWLAPRNFTRLEQYSNLLLFPKSSPRSHLNKIWILRETLIYGPDPWQQTEPSTPSIFIFTLLFRYWGTVCTDLFLPFYKWPHEHSNIQHAFTFTHNVRPCDQLSSPLQSKQYNHRTQQDLRCHHWTCVVSVAISMQIQVAPEMAAHL